MTFFFLLLIFDILNVRFKIMRSEYIFFQRIITFLIHQLAPLYMFYVYSLNKIIYLHKWRKYRHNCLVEFRVQGDVSSIY